MSDHRLPSAAAVQATTLFSNRRLTPEEFQAYVDAPVSEVEREEALQLICWFKKRYPTPVERLAYAQRAYARWTAHRR
jgi:hypothetical protein